LSQSDTDRELYDSLLQEYSQLREELRFHLSRKSRFELVLSLIAVLIGVSFKYTTPAPLLLMSFLPAFLIDEHARRLDAIARIASYIRSQIEPKVQGLNWESLGYVFMGNSNFLSRSVQGLDTIILFLLSGLQFGVAAWIWHSNTPNQSYFHHSNFHWIYLIAVVLAVAFVVVVRRFRSTKRNGEKYTLRWQQIAHDKTPNRRRD
jgi:hypothetical protein